MPPKRKCPVNTGGDFEGIKIPGKKAKKENQECTMNADNNTGNNITSEDSHKDQCSDNKAITHASPSSVDALPPNSDSVRTPAKVLRPTAPDKAVNIAVASRALFSMEKEHEVFEGQGLEEYIKLQVKNENVDLQKGPALPFIQALNHVNRCLKILDDAEENIFNIVLMSHNHAQAGVRLIHSIRSHELGIQRICLTGGTNPVDYLHAYNITLYLTSYAEEVEQALERGFAAAAIFEQPIQDPVREQLRVAFDLDAVLFSKESDKVYNSIGFEAYIVHEQSNADNPISEGPLKNFASALGEMQGKFSKHRDLFPVSPIRTYIVTARSACVGERAIKTLRSWGLDVDELHFLSGAPKGPILEAIKPHIFFDDSHSNIESAQKFGTPAAHVKFGAGGYVPKVSSQSVAKCNLSKKMSFFNE